VTALVESEEGAPLVQDGWRMEGLKRALDAVPGLLGHRRQVRLCGLPAPDDVDGALRLEGLLCQLSASGVRAAARRAGSAATPGDAVIWLGGGGAAALAGLRDAGAVLLWPSPDDMAAAAALEEAAGIARPHWVMCHAVPDHPRALPGLRHVLLPEPGHALWGLLDHHPRREGGGAMLDLSGGRDWPPMVLARPGGGIGKRAARAAFVAALPPARAERFRRRRVLEAARRCVAAHTAVATDRVGTSIFAALLGRPTVPRGGAVAAYWAARRGTAPALPAIQDRAAPPEADSLPGGHLAVPGLRHP
jgi:hypothetical protein